MRKLLFGMLISMMVVSWIGSNVVEPAIDAVKAQVNATIIQPILEPMNQFEQFSNDPTHTLFE